MTPEMQFYTGIVKERIPSNGNYRLICEKGDFFLGRRSPTLSNSDAISKIGNYGVVPVIWIGIREILTPYKYFKQEELNILQLASLLKAIHSNKTKELVLVHGDFSRKNTTLDTGNPKCFDYEYTHWGNPYIDIGRLILREIKNERELEGFFEHYSGSMPKVADLKEGLITFCERQAKMREEKMSAFQEVPRIRARRINESPKDIHKILEAFTAPVNHG